MQTIFPLATHVKPCYVNFNFDTDPVLQTTAKALLTFDAKLLNRICILFLQDILDHRLFLELQ